MASYKKIDELEDKEAAVRITERLLALRRQLKKDIPGKTATETLLIATWNIREFGEGRLPESYHYIAEIIDHFDIVVVQEVNSTQMGGLKTVMKILGDNWSYIVSDGVEGTDGGSEAMAFVFNTNKVQFTSLAGEIVLPQSGLIKQMQFARTPFVASFMAGWFAFKLCTVHIFYGSEKNSEGIIERRRDEIKAISKFLLDRAKKEDTSYILLGDFNIPDINGEYFNALSSIRKKNGFYVPEEIREHPTDLGGTAHYDQIAFKLTLDDEKMVVFNDRKQEAGAFNFTDSVFSLTDEDAEVYSKYYMDTYLASIENRNASAIKRAAEKGKTPKLVSDTPEERLKYFKKWRTFQMSDHLPLWTELRIDFSDEYLKNVKEKIVDGASS